MHSVIDLGGLLGLRKSRRKGRGSVYVIMVAGEACRRYVESDIAAAGNLTDICLSRYIDK